MINYNDAETALNYLVNTDEEAARAKALYDGLYEQRKPIRAVELIKNAHIDYEIFKNKRASNILICDMWRSVNSNQKKGNI